MSTEALCDTRKGEIVCTFPKQPPPFVDRQHPGRDRGVHAVIAQALMKRPGKWVLVVLASYPKHKLTPQRRRSLSAALHSGALFGHQFQVRVHDGHTYARYVQ